MKRHFILLLALALVAAACGGSGDVVATVNGRDVTVDDVAGLRPESGSTDSESFRNELRNTIVEFVVIDVAESEFGITYTDEEVEARKQEIIAQIEEPGTVTYEDAAPGARFTVRLPDVTS